MTISTSDAITQARLVALQDAYREGLSAVSEQHSVTFNQIVADVLARWAARFPRHKFSVREGHGMMSVDVAPPVCGVNTLNMERAAGFRGAVAEVITEASMLVDAFNDSEQRVCLWCDEMST